VNQARQKEKPWMRLHLLQRKMWEHALKKNGTMDKEKNGFSSPHAPLF